MIFEMHNWLEDLNEQQSQAVQANDKPLLILAGAGTGKTKTIVAKIGHIITTQLATPEQIIGLTFTNKAAKEMKERLAVKLDVNNIWLGTFHSTCVKILRTYHQHANIDQHFLIADQSESEQLIKNILKESYSDKTSPVLHKSFAKAISKLKEKCITYDSSNINDREIEGIAISKLYKEYQTRLRRSNLLDFDDLIMTTTQMLQTNINAREQLNNKFKYLFVDEYQDTSSGQNALIHLLCGKNPNICCVGDEDQSIYSWRGAEVKNILDFTNNFQSANIIRLEQNYRSTSNIVNTAASLIKNNKDRYDKTLRTNIDAGEKVRIVYALNGKDEGLYIADQILNAKNRKNINLDNVAVLVRSSFQNKALEEAFNERTLPYRIVDGVKFYERKEIKDLISYLRLIYSHYDELSFARAINTPKRGIGGKTISHILEYSTTNFTSPVDAMQQMLDANSFSAKQQENIKEFNQQIRNWNKEIAGNVKPLHKIAEEIVYQTGYMDELKLAAEIDVTAEDRINNIKTFISDLEEFNSIEAFLEHVSLASSLDSQTNGSAVNILTIHASKGLEFDIVFCPGWEENIFPSARTLEYNNDSAIEEERRLGYVAITRARKEVTILHADSRFTFGTWRNNEESRFISEIKRNALNDTMQTMQTENSLSRYNQKQNADRYLNTGNTIYGNPQDQFRQTREYRQQSNQYRDNTQYKSHHKPSKPLTVNCKIIHKTLGRGTVQKLMGHYAEVKLDNEDCKKLIHKSFITVIEE